MQAPSTCPSIFVSTDGKGDPNNGAQPSVITAANSSSGAPRLDLQKRWVLAGNVAGDKAVNPGDSLLYTLIVSNVGSAVARDVRVVDDPLPTQVTLIPGSLLTSRGSVVSEWPITVNVGDLDPGAMASVSFRVVVKTGTAGQSASNQATATTASIAGSVPSYDDGNASNGLNPTVTPILHVPMASIPTLFPATQLALAVLMLLLGWRSIGRYVRAGSARRQDRG